MGFVQHDILVSVAGPARARAGSGELGFHRLSMRIDVAVEMDVGGAGLAGQLRKNLHRIAGPEDEAGTHGFQIGRQGSKAGAKEFLAAWSGPAVLLFPAAQDVDRNDRTPGGGGGVQRGIVGEAEVAAEPVDDGR